ncbi:hypothetical protein PHJA_000181200 [Phtheirospermum japonicum]|uniref:Uncharacterized protein n=1 Tax=Phtheirospermum japonicum TaxID=374723 RepID=A0A830B5V3_9LAMI|nr:hypothetical protein PHJA_000181200 [Phtheirospermum japonicum]
MFTDNKSKAAGDKPQAAAAGAWNPTFKLEDFMPPAEKADQAEPSNKQLLSDDSDDKGDKGLDLNLSL